MPHKCTAVPANLVEGMEIFGDLRDGGGYNSHVESDEKDAAN